MTADEIKALRIELEDALLTCFNDFHQLTGLCIVCTGISTVEIQAIGKPPEKRITSVQVGLESL